MAIGAGGTIPVMPQLPNKVSWANSITNSGTNELQDQFKGLAIHSVDYKNAKDWKDKRGVIIGTGNTGKRAC